MACGAPLPTSYVGLDGRIETTLGCSCLGLTRVSHHFVHSLDQQSCCSDPTRCSRSPTCREIKLQVQLPVAPIDFVIFAESEGGLQLDLDAVSCWGLCWRCCRTTLDTRNPLSCSSVRWLCIPHGRALALFGSLNVRSASNCLPIPAAVFAISWFLDSFEPKPCSITMTGCTAFPVFDGAQHSRLICALSP